jgi:hypothetical protein
LKVELLNIGHTTARSSPVLCNRRCFLPQRERSFSKGPIEAGNFGPWQTEKKLQKPRRSGQKRGDRQRSCSDLEAAVLVQIDG